MTDEQFTDKVGSPCPEFWDWLPRAYRDGDVGMEPRFTKYNMEVAYLAGRQAKQNLGKPEPNLQDNEQYRLQMAAICTAAIGYWKESDSICPEYDTLALRDVAKLHVKYVALCDKLAQLEQMLLQNLVKIPTLSHGVLVKLSDVEAIIKRIKPSQIKSCSMKTKDVEQTIQDLQDRLTEQEQQAIIAAIKDSSMVVHEGRMMSEEYDVVLDAMQRHRDRLWAMTERNMRSEFIGLNIMDDIRLKQIEELDQAITQRQTRKISTLTEDQIRKIWWSAEIAGTEFASPVHRAVKFARAIEAKLLGVVDENKIS